MTYTLDILWTKIEQLNREVTMTIALTEQISVEEVGMQAASLEVRDESICIRCGGLMAKDFCLDLLNSADEMAFAAKRCVQCGEVVDPVILRNRRLQSTSSEIVAT